MNYKNLTYIINFIFPLTLILIFSNCYNKVEEFDLLHKSNPDGWYGSSFTITVKNKIDNLLNSPEEYLGKEVLVTGEITEICPMRGCWIDIKTLNQNQIFGLRLQMVKLFCLSQLRGNTWMYRVPSRKSISPKNKPKSGKSI